MAAFQNRTISIDLVPDRFAQYRLPIFRTLGDASAGGFDLTIYADTESDLPSLKIADARYCNLDISSGGVRWVRIRNLGFRGRCFWQTGLLKLAFSGNAAVIVYWGEAHRISTWLSAIIARLCGRKIIFWGHGLYGREARITRAFRIAFYRLADANLLYSRHAEKLLKEAGLPRESLFVIKNSLDTSLQNQLYHHLPDLNTFKTQYFSATDVVLTFIGRLQRNKQLDLLLRAIRRLHDDGHADIKALIIGDGPEGSTLRSLVDELSLAEDVVFYGPCYDEKSLAPLIAMSDICVAPGEVGLTAMHSLVYGTPVITHDDFAHQMPESEAIEEGISGVFFDRGSIHSLCTAILKCITHLQSGEISAATCRSVITKTYTTDFQLKIFRKAVLFALNSTR